MPLYKQLADVLRERITTGELPPGHPVPSETELMSQYGVARITARNAVKVLLEEGLVYPRRGDGFYVGPQDAPRVPRARVVYLGIARELAARIRAGQYAPDMPIPSQRRLAEELGVAVGTLREAVQLLQEQGWVYIVPQRGTYVSQPENWPAESEKPDQAGSSS